MGVINAIDRDGAEHRLEGLERASFMEIMKRAGLSVEALCSGSCQCATCHMYVDEAWLDRLPPQTEFEIATLEGEAEEIMRPNSRLGCQLRWDESYDGIRVTVAPEL
jgi:2Fe-2S ferredoxin